MKINNKRLRQASQIIVLCVFLFLFRKTDYLGSDTIPYAVNLFFRLDPLVAATIMLAEKAFFWLFLPSVIVIGTTLLLGRWFCGWFCPMGTLIDFFDRWLPRTEKPIHIRFVKYMILGTVLLASLSGVNFTGFVDPFSILVRGMAFAVDPLFNYGTSTFFDTIYVHGPGWLSGMTEPVYNILKIHILPYKQSFFQTGLFSFFCLVAVFGLSFMGKRFWCRNICPLGGFLALFSRTSILRRTPVKACPKCRKCPEHCRMEAFDQKGSIMIEECNLCMECQEFCPESIIRFSIRKPVNRGRPDFNRRQFVTTAFFGLSLPMIIKTNALSKLPAADIIRPPGALARADFQAVCVRCGECMKVCITNGLQPLSLEQGIDGMFTPRLIPRLGYCEYNCTLCGQVCPTGAIRKIPLPEKHVFVIGKAFFDTSRCLPHAAKTACIVCEEHCPTPDKAISFKEVTVTGADGNMIQIKQPFIIESLCIGCGICENVCPVQGEAAVRVIAADASKAFAGYG